MTTKTNQPNTAPTSADDPLARAEREKAQLRDELEATRLEMNVTTFVRAQGGSDEDAGAVAASVEAARKQAKATGQRVDWMHATKLALHERKSASGQPTTRPLDPHGEPTIAPDPRTGRAPRTWHEVVAERERYQARLRALRIADPANGSYPGAGVLAGGDPIE